MVIEHSFADGFFVSRRLGKSRLDRVMKDFILDFEYLAEGLLWYFGDVFQFVSDELLAFCMVLASLSEDLLVHFYSQILIA